MPRQNLPHPSDEAQQGRLSARPTSIAVVPSDTPGLHSLGLDARRDALLYVPTSYNPARPAPLVLALHGAGGDAENGLWPLRDLADEGGFLLLSPWSRGRTWDVILGEYGPDVEHINNALGHVFARYAVDATRLAVSGFSDGASYALSLALINGDLFTHCMAFAPGFMAPTSQRGRPRFFISHGTNDKVLPIDVCSRRVVPRLKQAGYDVEYREFEGGHTAPPEIAQEAARWFLPGGAKLTSGPSPSAST